MSSKLSGEGSNFIGLYFEAESHSHGSRVATAKVPVAILDDMLLRDGIALGIPHGLQISSKIDVVPFEVVPSELLLIFSKVVVTEAVSNIIVWPKNGRKIFYCLVPASLVRKLWNFIL